MSVIANEEKTNRDLISAFLAYSSQPSVHGDQTLVSVLSACNIQPFVTALVVRPPSGAATATGMNANPPTQATISTATQEFPENNVKLQSILKR